MRDVNDNGNSGKETRRGEASAAALAGLRIALAQGQLRPGEPVIEEEWAERLGVSRTPIRAAIGVLAAEGMLVKRGRQVHVFRPSLADLLEVYEIRRELEGLAASLALQLGPADLARAMDDHFAQLRSAEGTPEWFGHHEQFHMTIIDSCGNSRLSEMIRALRLQSEPYVRYAVNADPRFRTRAMSDHRKMVAAIRKGEAAELRALVERHLKGTVDEVNRLLALTDGYGVAPLLEGVVGAPRRP